MLPDFATWMRAMMDSGTGRGDARGEVYKCPHSRLVSPASKHNIVSAIQLSQPVSLSTCSSTSRPLSSPLSLCSSQVRRLPRPSLPPTPVNTLAFFCLCHGSDAHYVFVFQLRPATARTTAATPRATAASTRPAPPPARLRSMEVSHLRPPVLLSTFADGV